MKCVSRVGFYAVNRRRSPCGERGLKCPGVDCLDFCGKGRSPCGERGLKYAIRAMLETDKPVAPRAGSVD